MRIIASSLLALSLLAAAPALAQETALKLPAPDTTGGMPLMQALAERHTTRAFLPDPIDDATLGNLLWAAWGQNRPGGKRTAPSARNKQNLKVYVNRQDGLWLYDAPAHSLNRIAAQPLGSLLNEAPVVLIFAVPKDDPYGYMHVGSVYQNAGLFCASAGLGNVVKTSTTLDPTRYSFLPQGWKTAATQSIGKPRQ